MSPYRSLYLPSMRSKTTLESLIRERFGEPIRLTECGDNQGVPSSNKKVDMGNRGFGSELDEDELKQVAPPGMEDLVKKLKKDKSVENPWAVAWKVYKQKKGGD